MSFRVWIYFDEGRVEIECLTGKIETKVTSVSKDCFIFSSKFEQLVFDWKIWTNEVK